MSVHLLLSMLSLLKLLSVLQGQRSAGRRGVARRRAMSPEPGHVDDGDWRGRRTRPRTVVRQQQQQHGLELLHEVGWLASNAVLANYKLRQSPLIHLQPTEPLAADRPHLQASGAWCSTGRVLCILPQCQCQRCIVGGWIAISPRARARGKRGALV